MTILFTFLIPPAILLIADAMGWIDLSTRPLPRVLKWVCVAAVAWFLPLLAEDVFHLGIDEGHLNLWKLIILGVLGWMLVSAILKWTWQHYGPPPEGHRRCPHCRQPVLKVMLECPDCRKALD